MSTAARKSRATFAPVACGIACRALTAAMAKAITPAARMNFIEGRMLTRLKNRFVGRVRFMGRVGAKLPAIAAILRSLHKRQHSRRSTRRAFVFRSTDNDRRTGSRDTSEVRHQFHAVFTCAKN